MTPLPLLHLPAEGSPTLLFVLLHGVGARAADLAALARRLVAEYPQAAAVGLDGPHAFDAAPPSHGGRQWFSIVGVNEDNRAARVAAALPEFVATIRALQQRFGTSWPCTALVGFSQGAIMALEAVQAEPALAGRVIAFSGRHARAPEHAPADTTVHLLHGLEDRVIPPGPVIDAAQRLVALGGDVTADVLPGIGHELHPALLERAIGHLRSFLPKRAWREAMGEAPVISRVASSAELGR
jgi:phospholipase/carboxylesterase